jgi:hypothetical protein
MDFSYNCPFLNFSETSPYLGTTVRVLVVLKGELNERKLGYFLLLRPIPPDDIRNTSAIAKKLCRSVVIEEHFEFAIRAAHTVKISAGAQYASERRSLSRIVRVPRECRHTAAIVNTA